MVIEKVLEILQGGAEATATIFDAMMADYQTSRRKIGRASYKGGIQFKNSWAEEYRENQKFYTLLGYLKRQGLVEAKKKENKNIWHITKKGIEKLEVIKERNLYSKTTVDYSEKEKQGSESVKIITYDIPAKENPKRSWIRWALANLDFTMLQRSVWLGKRKIPEEFLIDLRKRKMMDYVQIFEVAKSGTIKEIK